MLTREEILGTEDGKFEDVEVPEWGGSVRVRTLTGKERQKFQKGLSADGDAPDDFMERLIVAVACDAAGKPIFTKEDIAALSEKAAVALDRLFRAAADLNGLTSEAQENIKGE